MTDWSLPGKDLALIRKAGDPPDDSNSGLRDPNWSHLFFKWAEVKRDGGDPQPLYLYQLESCLAPENSLTLKEYYPRFFVDGAEWPIPIPDDLKAQAKSVVEDSSPDISEDTVKDNLRFYVDPKLINYYRDFCKDVRAKQQEAIAKEQQQAVATVGGASASNRQPVTTTTVSRPPQKVALTRDRIDQAAVDKINEVALKDLQPDSQPTTFLMSDDLLLIGDDHQEAYVEFAEKNGGKKGRLAMKSKGGAFSTGEILVQRVSGVDEAKLKAAVKRFSQKKVTFQDVIPDII